MPDSSTDQVRELTVEFDLSISADEYLRYYQGQIKWVMAVSTKGLKVKFPANLLAPYISHNGIHGRFVLHYLSSGKAVKLHKTA